MMRPIRLGAQDVLVTPSVGIAVYPTDGNVQTLSATRIWRCTLPKCNKDPVRLHFLTPA